MTLRPLLVLIRALLFVSTGKAGTASDLTGLWQAQILAQLQTGGTLTIDGRKPSWEASISGMRAVVRRNEDAIQFILPTNQGEFRGGLLNQKIVGHWIQPPNEINRNNSYATPLQCTQVAPKLWRGTVTPMPAQLTFWLSIQPGLDGSLIAVIRNPEFNLFRHSTYQVELHDAAITFSDAKDPSEKFEGRFEPSAELLTARPPNVDRSIQFRRVAAEQATGLFARNARDKKYDYHQPSAGDDGWMTATLKDADLDAKPIALLIDKIVQADPTNNPLNIHSLLIARHGKLALEEYFYGFAREQTHDMRSASKTFAPLMIGIAREHGAKIDINAPVYSLFPEFKQFANPDARKEKMTVRDLMTMTSGFACDDNDESSPGQEDRISEQKAQSDWYKYTLDLPMARDPGGDQAVYCSAGINLLGGVVRNATHTWLPDFFCGNVAKPLQIKTYHWNLMPTNDGYSGGGLRMRPRDQLKLGQLYLNGGTWNGRRVVSKDWVERSTSTESRFEPVFGIDHEYGYAWHIHHLKAGDKTYRVYAAEGNGGQMVIVIPDLDMVIGFTGGSYNEFPKWIKWEIELVPQFIIPAATSTKS